MGRCLRVYRISEMRSRWTDSLGVAGVMLSEAKHLDWPRASALDQILRYAQDDSIRRFLDSLWNSTPL